MNKDVVCNQILLADEVITNHLRVVLIHNTMCKSSWMGWGIVTVSSECSSATDVAAAGRG